MARLGGGAAATDKAPKAVKTAKTAGARPAPRAKPSGGAFVGLDIGTSAIKAVEVRGAGAGLTVTGMAMTHTPPGLIQNGVVMDPKALGVAIKQLLQKNGMRAGKVVTAATGADSVVVRVIEVPRMTPSELAETMKWEVERHIPFSVNDVEMAYVPLDTPGALADDPNNPNMDVLLAVARRDMVGLQIDTLSAGGLNPVAIDIEPLAVGRALIDLSPGKSLLNKNVVVVNIGASTTEVGIFKNGILRFPRSIPLAGDTFTRAIADHLGLTMDAAEDEKRQNAAVMMDLVGVTPDNTFPGSNDDNPFQDFGNDGTIPPPLFGGTPTPEPDVIVSTPPPEQPVPITPGGAASPFDLPVGAENDPFATPAAGSPFDPFANTGSPAETAAVPVSDDPISRRRRDIFDALLPVLGELSMEVRRSIDYFRSRYPADTVDQILLCGGSARIMNLDQFFQQDLNVGTAIADPFASLKVASKQMSAGALKDVAPAYTVALGLAVRDAVIGS